MLHEYICRSCGAEFMSENPESSEAECPECYAMDAEATYVEIESEDE